jgi:hypothetical protein
MMISESRPTTLAVEMGKALNMTLAFSDDGSELVIVCGETRIKIEPGDPSDSSKYLKTRSEKYKTISIRKKKKP